MPTESEKERLPFEPNRKRKKGVKAKTEITDQAEKPTESTEKVVTTRRSYTREETEIPEVVSRRMLKRMLFFSGIPVTVGIFVFFASYVVIIQGIADLPNVAVLLATLACFGLSVVGLSYGALSASWEEDAVGTILGFEQFQINFERLIGSWRQAREERQGNS